MFAVGNFGHGITDVTASEPVLMALVGGGGAVEADAVAHLADDLERAVDTGATCLLVDLRQAESVSTRGLNALLRARNRLLRRDGKIVVVLSRELRHQFDVLQLDRKSLLDRPLDERRRHLGHPHRQVDRRQSPIPPERCCGV